MPFDILHRFWLLTWLSRWRIRLIPFRVYRSIWMCVVIINYRDIVLALMLSSWVKCFKQLFALGIWEFSTSLTLSMTHKIIPCFVPAPEGLGEHSFHLDFLLSSQLFILSHIFVIQESRLKLLIQSISRLSILYYHRWLIIDSIPSFTSRTHRKVSSGSLRFCSRPSKYLVGCCSESAFIKSLLSFSFILWR